MKGNLRDGKLDLETEMLGIEDAHSDCMASGFEDDWCAVVNCLCLSDSEISFRWNIYLILLQRFTFYSVLLFMFLCLRDFLQIILFYYKDLLNLLNCLKIFATI